MNDKKVMNILLKQNVELITYLLEQISVDYKLDKNELKDKYLSSFKKNSKRNTNKKGRFTSYTMFLSDKEIDGKLREENEGIKFSEIQKLKGDIWRAMCKGDKDKYALMAKAYNETLKPN